MICTCGKQMCYICRQPVDSNYDHFYNEKVIKNKYVLLTTNKLYNIKKCIHLLSIIRCPLYTDENIVHTTAVEAAARLIINELKIKKPELLRNIDINKILPALKKPNKIPTTQKSALDINKIVATIIGQNVEDINNLKDMSEFLSYFNVIKTYY